RSPPSGPPGWPGCRRCGRRRRRRRRSRPSHPSLPLPTPARQHEAKDRPAAWPLVDPDPAAVTLDDPLANGEPDARARVVVAGMQPLEHLEDPIAVQRLDADAVDDDRDAPAPV